MTRGPLPERMWEWSLAKVTSRIQCSRLLGRRGASLRRAPLRTVRATRRGTRLKQPAWAGRHLFYWSGLCGLSSG
jgi:hypothetical protein